MALVVDQRDGAARRVCAACVQCVQCVQCALGQRTRRHTRDEKRPGCGPMVWKWIAAARVARLLKIVHSRRLNADLAKMLNGAGFFTAFS
jgi:hypothetical protein